MTSQFFDESGTLDIGSRQSHSQKSRVQNAVKNKKTDPKERKDLPTKVNPRRIMHKRKEITCQVHESSLRWWVLI